MSIFYVSQSSKPQKTSAKQARANAEHQAWLKSVGYTSGMKIVNTRELPRYDYRRVTSDLIPGAGGYKKSVEDYKWRKDQRESKATIEEIERKKTRIAPAYNKGAVQYVTDGTDPRYIGKKV